MANPVLEALLNSRVQEEPTAFGKWCVRRGVKPLPARPEDVAAFIKEHGTLPMEKIWPWVQEISQAHLVNGLADPTAGGIVGHIITNLANIDPPRSWPDPLKKSFRSLPWNVQVYIAKREKERDAEVRRAQNEAAAARKELAAIKQSPGKTNGSIQSQTA